MKPHHARRGIALLAALALLTVVSAGPAPADTGPLPVDPALYVSFSDGPFLVDWNGGFRARVRVYGHVTGKARVKLSISDAGGAKELGISPAQVTVTPIGTDFDFPVLVTGKLARRQEAGAFEVEATLLPRIGDPVMVQRGGLGSGRRGLDKLVAFLQESGRVAVVGDQRHSGLLED